MTFEEAICEWYQLNKRDLPWRRNSDPYAIWVSEIMLQQTKIETVIPYYTRFMTQVPTYKDLAMTDDEVLLKLWQGLGYYSRVRNMKKAALEMMTLGYFPTSYEELVKLKGIGPYTAAAIASFAFHQKVVCVDGNVMRVYERFFNCSKNVLVEDTKKYIHNQLVTLVGEDSSSFNQGLMELGETICLPSNPKCEICPLKDKCQANCLSLQNELPVREKELIKKIIHKNIILYIWQNKILLRKREEKLLHGTYEPIEVDVLPHKAVLVGYYRHVFTHQIWEMDVYKVILEEEIAISNASFFSMEEIESLLPIATAYLKFFSKI